MQKEKVSLAFTIVPFKVLQVIEILFCLAESFEYILVLKVESCSSTTGGGVVSWIALVSSLGVAFPSWLVFVEFVLFSLELLFLLEFSVLFSEVLSVLFAELSVDVLLAS